MPRKPESRQIEKHKPRGSFRSDGSWSDSMEQESHVEQYVRTMVRTRRDTRRTPAEVGQYLSEGTHRDAFPSARYWSKWTQYEQWPHVCTNTAAEAAVKYCGVGEEQGHWESGLYVKGRDERDFVRAPDAEVGALVGNLMDGLKTMEPLKPWEQEP